VEQKCQCSSNVIFQKIILYECKCGKVRIEGYKKNTIPHELVTDVSSYFPSEDCLPYLYKLIKQVSLFSTRGK
jgi:hypothetical protein